MKSIGSTFVAELKAAGLHGLPFAWSADGALHFADGMAAEQIDAVKAVLDAHDPAAAVALPNLAGFMSDVMGVFTRRKLRTVIKAATLSAFQRGDVAAIKQDIDEMFTDAEITQTERDALYTRARARKLPGF